MQRSKPIIVDSIRRLNPKVVLDLGCGKCHFAKRFLDKGANVIGVDKEYVDKFHENFEFIQKDVLDFKFESKYDLIIGSGVLHYLEEKSAINLIKKMQKNTIAGGFHFLICMSYEECSENETYFYPNEKILNKLYSDWEVIHNISCLSKKHGKIMHQHKMIILLARKI